jgi:hypothetical protein
MALGRLCIEQAYCMDHLVIGLISVLFRINIIAETANRPRPLPQTHSKIIHQLHFFMTQYSSCHYILHVTSFFVTVSFMTQYFSRHCNLHVTVYFTSVHYSCHCILKVTIFFMSLYSSWTLFLKSSF